MGPRLQQAENQHHCVTLTAYRRQHRQVLLLRPMPQSRRGSEDDRTPVAEGTKGRKLSMGYTDIQLRPLKVWNGIIT